MTRITTTRKGKKVVYTTRKTKTGKVQHYRDGVKLTKPHDLRIARSLQRQATAGKTPSIAVARGHRDERTSKAARRRAFYEEYAPYLLTQREIDADESLAVGSVVYETKDGRHTMKRKSWAAPWRHSLLGTRYDWYAKVRVLTTDESGTPGSDKAIAASSTPPEAWLTTEMTVLLAPADTDRDLLSGFYMDDIIDNFPENLDRSVRAIGLTPASATPGVDATEPHDYLIALFRHRTPSEARKRRDDSPATRRD